MSLLAAQALLSIICFFASMAAADPLDELRENFTVGGKPVPPEIFADFGDVDLADSDPIVVTIDARAASGRQPLADLGNRACRGFFQ